MAYTVNELITLGIGTPAEIAPFILVGLAPVAAPVAPSGVPGLSGNSAMTGLSGGSDDWDVE